MLISKLNDFRTQKKSVFLAWCIHLLTASGALWGFMAIVSVINHQWQAAFLWMALAVVVDSFDGILARKLGVVGLTPTFDGALLDNIVDYLTYVIVPALLIYEAGLLETAVAFPAVALIVLSSAFQFSQGDAKTTDHTFKGFPSYWNVVAFYLFMFQWSSWLNFTLILFFAILVFVPIKYLYPSRMKQYRLATLILTTFWGTLVTIIMIRYPNHSKTILWFSLSYTLYYAGLSLYLMKQKKKKRNVIIKKP
jgi:phosphatidylcholine synthase